jgi:hypothetical protein
MSIEQKRRYIPQEVAVFVAAPYEKSGEAEKVAQHLCEEIPTLRIVSRWHRTTHPGSLCNAQFTNVRDLQTAEIMVALTFAGLGREMFVEIGRHIAKARRVLWFPMVPTAPIENDCLSLLTDPFAQHVPNLTELCDYLRVYSKNRD